MEVYVKESLHVLDYKDNIVDSIFLSDDHMTPGYAYDITITEANTGYSDLKFNMPNMVVDSDGNKIHNPKLKLLTPLVKLRYHRQVYYMGDNSITVREPQGYGDNVTYVDKTYSNKYPDNIIENYIMDYIVQPVDKKRDVLKLTTSFTAIDYPRFNLSKKKVGLNISQDTLTKKDWTLYQNKPMDVAGTIKYQQWTNDLTTAAGGDTTKVPLEWWPDRESEYPLNEELITNLMNNTASWPYGLLGTAFYWPIKSTARFEGTMYKEGGFLVLQLYDFYALTTEGVSPEKHVGRYAWDWTQLYEVDSYLTPNRADNYLFHILEDTNWSVKMREDGTPDVDIVQVDIPNPAGSTTSTTQTDHTCNISVSNSNCYNAITAVCQGLQLYPVFDCVNREVSLRAFSGKNYGLAYRLGLNLTSNGTKLDGEKVITKLYVTGGKDYQGDQNINIGEAERSYIVVSMLPSEYQQIDYIESTGTQYIDTGVVLTEQHGVRLLFKPTTKESSIVFGSRKSATVSNFAVLTRLENGSFDAVVDFYNYQKNRILTPIELNEPVLIDMDNLSLSVNEVSQDIKTYAPFTTPGNALIFNGTGSFPWATKASMQLYECTILENGTIRKRFIPCYRKSDGVAGLYETVEGRFYTNAGTGTFIKGPSGAGDPDNRLPWNPNDPGYIIKRSPYGTNYILNFKWMYDNDWITKEDILDIYTINQKINDLNKEFMIPYTEDRLRTLQMYNDAVNQYDLKQGEYKSTLNSMMNKYYNVYGEYSEGTFYAFHKAPLGLHDGTEPENLGKQCLWIGHCSSCKNTWSSASKPTACTCGKTDIKVNEIYIPLYSDFEDTVVPPSNPQYPYGPDIDDPAYEPYLKGDYLKLVTTLDNENGDWSIEDYEDRISLITPIAYRSGTTVDDREYVIDGVYVKASSGNIEEWNQDIELFVNYYGEMLDALDTVNYCLEKIAKLEEEYEEWKAEYDGYHAEIQDKYGDYIIEGNYSNAEQPYVGLLFQEGVEASDKYSIPEVTYSLDVIDSSGLIEYRQPMVTTYSCSNCKYGSHTPITECPRCGETVIVTTYDTYNDLVHLLHSVGQIVPKAGDYVSIYDEPMGMYGVPGLITEISRTLDKPINNKIKLDTAYTDDEELVGNIITATNTVLNNADIYARTAVLKADGTIDSGAISQTLDNPNANISIAGTNGNMLLTGSYLRFTDPVDSTKAIKYSGTGIFTTTTLGENGESVEWQKMITPTGINATYLNAGQIDTKHINIMSGMTSKILIDQYGMVVKDQANKSAHITPFDSSKAKTDADYAAQWGVDNNISGFLGVDSNNDALIYTKGFLVANEGSNIANWITSDNGFYHLDSDGDKDLWLSPVGISGTVLGKTTNYSLYANGNFGVTTGGSLYANGATISGKVTVTDSGSAINTGTVGGWTSTTTGLKNSSTSPTLELSPAGGTSHTVNNSGSRSDWAIYANGNFGVTTGGTLYAKGCQIDGSGTFSGTVHASAGEFTGKITAGEGSIGGWTIGTSSLYSDYVSLTSSSGATTKAININSGTFYVQNNGYLRSTSGKIGNWSIGSTSITNGNTTLGSSGRISFSSGDAFFAMGNGSDHPVASALSVRDEVAFYTGLSVDGSGTYQGVLGYSDTHIRLEANGGVGAWMGRDKDAQSFLITTGGTMYLNNTQGTGEIRLHPSGNDKLYVYGSYDNNTGYHCGDSGKFEYDPGWGTGTQFLCFVNGIFVGTA